MSRNWQEDTLDLIREQVGELIDEKLGFYEDLLERVGVLCLTSFLSEEKGEFTFGELQSLNQIINLGYEDPKLYLPESNSFGRLKEYKLPSIHTLMEVLKKEVGEASPPKWDSKSPIARPFRAGTEYELFHTEYRKLVWELREKVQNFDFEYVLDLALESDAHDDYGETLESFHRNWDGYQDEMNRDEWYWEDVMDAFRESDEYFEHLFDSLKYTLEERDFGDATYYDLAFLMFINEKGLDTHADHKYNKYKISDEAYELIVKESDLPVKAFKILESIRIEGSFLEDSDVNRFESYSVSKLVEEFSNIASQMSSADLTSEILDENLLTKPFFKAVSFKGLGQFTFENQMKAVLSGNIESFKDFESRLDSILENIKVFEQVGRRLKSKSQKALDVENVQLELFEYSEEYPEIFNLTSNAFNIENDISFTYLKAIVFEEGDRVYKGEIERYISEALGDDAKFNLVIALLDGRGEKKSYSELKHKKVKVDFKNLKITKLGILSENNISFQVVANKAEEVLLNPSSLLDQYQAWNYDSGAFSLLGACFTNSFDSEGTLQFKEHTFGSSIYPSTTVYYEDTSGRNFKVTEVSDFRQGLEIILQHMGKGLFSIAMATCDFLKGKGGYTSSTFKDVEALKDSLDLSNMRFLMLNFGTKNRPRFELYKIQNYIREVYEESYRVYSEYKKYHNVKIEIKNNNTKLLPQDMGFPTGRRAPRYIHNYDSVNPEVYGRRTVEILDLSGCTGLSEVEDYSIENPYFFLTANSPDLYIDLIPRFLPLNYNTKHYNLSELSDAILGSEKSTVCIDYIDTLEKPSQNLSILDVSDCKGYVCSAFHSNQISFVKYLKGGQSISIVNNEIARLGKHAKIVSENFSMMRIWGDRSPKNTLSYYEVEGSEVSEAFEWEGVLTFRWFKNSLFKEISEEQIMLDVVSRFHNYGRPVFEQEQVPISHSPFFTGFSRKAKIKKNKVTLYTKDGGSDFLSYLGLTSLVYTFEYFELSQPKDVNTQGDHEGEKLFNVSFKIKRDFKLGKNVNFIATSILSYIYPQMLLRFEEHCQPNSTLNKIPLGSAMELLTEEEVQDPQRFLTASYGVLSRIVNRINFIGCTESPEGLVDFFKSLINSLDEGSDQRNGYIGAVRYLYSFIDYYTKPLSILHNVLLNPGQYGLERSNPLLKKGESSASSYSFRPVESWVSEYFELIKESQGEMFYKKSPLYGHVIKNGMSPDVETLESELDYWDGATVAEYEDLVRMATQGVPYESSFIYGEALPIYEAYEDSNLQRAYWNKLESEYRTLQDLIKKNKVTPYRRYEDRKTLRDSNGDEILISDFSAGLHACVNVFSRFWVRVVSDLIGKDFYDKKFFKNFIKGGNRNVPHIADLSEIFEYGVFSTGLKKIKENKSTSIGDSKVPFVEASFRKGRIPYTLIKQAESERICNLDKVGTFGTLPNAKQESVHSKSRLDLGSYLFITNLIASTCQFWNVKEAEKSEYGPTIWRRGNLAIVQTSAISKEDDTFELDPVDPYIVGRRLELITQNYNLCIGQHSQPLRGNITDGRAQAFCFFNEMDSNLYACLYYLGGVIEEIKAGENNIIGSNLGASGMYRYGTTPTPNHIAKNINFKAVQDTFNFLFAMQYRDSEKYSFSLGNSDIKAVLPTALSFFEYQWGSENPRAYLYDYMSDSFKEVFLNAFSVILDQDLSLEETEQDMFDIIEQKGYGEKSTLPSLFFSEVWFIINQFDMNQFELVRNCIMKKDRFFGLLKNSQEDLLVLDRIRASAQSYSFDLSADNSLNQIVSSVSTDIQTGFFGPVGEYKMEDPEGLEEDTIDIIHLPLGLD